MDIKELETILIKLINDNKDTEKLVSSEYMKGYINGKISAFQLILESMNEVK